MQIQEIDFCFVKKCIKSYLKHIHFLEKMCAADSNACVSSYREKKETFGQKSTFLMNTVAYKFFAEIWLQFTKYLCHI